jgi:site-specific recombinase XerD
MAAVAKDEVFYGLYRDFFRTYLPKQRGCSPHTEKAYKKVMDDLLDFIKEKENLQYADITFKMIDSAMLTAFLDNIETNGGSVSTRNHRLACIRAFYKYAAKIEPLAVPYRSEIMKVPIKKSETSDVVDYMTEAEVKTVLAQPDTTRKSGLRNQFILLMFYDTGARISEIRGIRVRDVKLGSQPTVTLFGKGRKERVVPLSEKTAEHFSNYLSVFHPGATQYSEDYLFYVEHNGRKCSIGETTLRDMMTKYCDAARKSGAEAPDKISPHLWRHTRAMHLYQHGMDLTLVSQWLGHAKIETSLTYAHADTEHKRKAIEADVPDDSPLRAFVKPERFTVDDDDEQLRRLYGLR